MWSWAALAKLVLCLLDSKANSRLPGGLPGGTKGVWAQERLLGVGLSWAPTSGVMSSSHHQHFLSPSFGLVHILSWYPSATFWWLQPSGSPRQKVAKLGLGHSIQDCCGCNEDTKVQSGPSAQKWQNLL